jgi:aspartyl-tRNA(Asn)/glutamyl-tRNA(Gln) amidotransferase subunit A
LHSTSILKTRQQLDNKELRVQDVVESFLQTLKSKDDDIRAFTSIAGEHAMSRAAEVQQKIDAGTAGKLAGAVIGIKEAIVQKGRLSNSGSRMLEKYESVYNATVIDKLEAEDAIIIGRTNMDEFAMGSSTENSAFQITRNPHNTDKVPGGSSGGSAAAVAANMCHATLGSDTGGSIRQPAALCGVVGLRPTYGRVSRHGLIAYASSFDSIGPLTHNVEDAALMLEVLAGKDQMDATSSSMPVDTYAAGLRENASVKGLRIGFPEEYFGEGLDPHIKDIILKKVDELKEQGAEIVPVHLENTKYAVATYYILATAEASSNLARFDGIRYGHRADQKKTLETLAAEKKALEKAGEDTAELDTALIRLYKQSRTEGFGTEVKRRIMLGTYVLSSGYYDAYYAKAQKMRRLIQQDFQEAFKACDVLVSPTSPTTAFDVGSKIDNPLQMYLNDIYTISANLAGIPALSVPAGMHPEDQLPVGIQFMAPHFKESLLFRAGSAV